MAKSTKLYVVIAILSFCIFSCKSSAAARLLSESSVDAATEPEFNIVLHGKEKVGANSIAAASQSKDSEGHHVTPCELDDRKALETVKLGGRFGALVMNVKPKGNTPGSGPSRRNNDINT